MHTAEPLVLEPSSFEVKIAIEKLKRYKSPSTDQIPVGRIATTAEGLCYCTHFKKDGKTYS